MLKVLSQTLDECAARGEPLPRRVLDAGCGVGVIGVCAARAIMAMQGDAAGGVFVRAQDRDELARLVTSYNAEQNAIPSTALEAYTEPLLAGNADSRWDLIISNIPAKAGSPVLEDFVRRSSALLNPGGLVIMVAVRTLAAFFREEIVAGAELVCEEAGAEHSVFVYRAAAATSPGGSMPLAAGNGFPENYPWYARRSAAWTVEDIPLRLETIHGAGGFDEPGGAARAAAKLVRHIGALPESGYSLLVHEPEQGFFPCWLFQFLRGSGCPPRSITLSGRNILALQASRRNVQAAGGESPLYPVPAADLRLGAGALLAANGGGKYGLIAVFPELVPQSPLPKDGDQLAALWESLPPLLADGGVCIAGFGSADAERFDRKKPAGFMRLGGVRRKGFRALGYRFSGADTGGRAR